MHTADTVEMKIIARVRNGFSSKFGLPRQSGLVDAVESRIVFEPAYRVPEALRGIEGFSHLWILWEFHQAVREEWSPTVRPPRLGGNTRMGVFATRSPFRPNPIAMSCVRLLRVEHTQEEGDVLVVAGTDMMDGTPVLDIKPYIPYADCKPEAVGGFTENRGKLTVEVVIPEALRAMIPPEELEAVEGILAQDPRPGYQKDPDRVYGLTYAGMDIRFAVRDGVLTVREVQRTTGNEQKND